MAKKKKNSAVKKLVLLLVAVVGLVSMFLPFMTASLNAIGNEVSKTSLAGTAMLSALGEIKGLSDVNVILSAMKAAESPFGAANALFLVFVILSVAGIAVTILSFLFKKLAKLNVLVGILIFLSALVAFILYFVTASKLSVDAGGLGSYKYAVSFGAYLMMVSALAYLGVAVALKD